jgi:membrane-associated phospholipid phosphatase
VTRRIVLAFIALLSFLAFWRLGAYVRANGEPMALTVFEAELAGHGVVAAWWLTWACYVQTLVVIGVLLIVLAWRFPAWRVRIACTLVSAIVCWRVADFFQHAYARPRPAVWFVHHETAFSYPSSHAAIAVGFYGLWAVLLYSSELGRRTRLLSAAALVCLTVAICWARLALGAHYATDLAGGALVALSIVCLGAAVLPGNVVAPFAGRR